MKLEEVIALAKAGYRKKEIAAFVEAEEEETKTDPEPEDLPVPEETEPEAEEPEPDYKALYEETVSKLQEAQKANVRQPIPEPTSAETDFSELVKNFL